MNAAPVTCGQKDSLAVNDLSWRPSWYEGGPDYILVRDRHPSVDPEPETIGCITLFPPVGANDKKWKWSLTTELRIAGLDKPEFATSGFEKTQRGARDALIEAWRREKTFRADVRANPKFDEMSTYMQSFIENGQLTPARWKRVADTP